MTTTEIEQRTAAPTRWTLDSDATSVEFAVKTFWGLMTVHGRFDRFDGWYEDGPGGTTIELALIPATGRATSTCARPTSSRSTSTRRSASRRPASTT